MPINRREFITMTLAAGSVALLPISDAFAEPPIAISSLPFTINASGSYILATNLSVSLEAGAAIQVTAPNVTIDLNGKTITNSNASANTLAVGIIGFADALTVKNGTVRGFYVGVYTKHGTNTLPGRHNINMVEANACLGAGFMIDGSGSVVRGCSVTNQGRSTAGTRYSCLYSFGIILSHGSGILAVDNIVNSSGYSSSDTSIGVYANTYAREASFTNNRVASARIGFMAAPECRCEIKGNRTTTSASPYFGTFVDLGGNT